jgi:hypothetical protein
MAITICHRPGIVGLALLLSACDGGRPPSDTVPLATYRLSGQVTEMTATGPAPLEGVRIEESATHQQTTTDAGGFYILSGLYAARSRFEIGKAGYLTESKTLSISGDTRLSLQLRKIPSAGSSSRGSFALPVQEAKHHENHTALGRHHPGLPVRRL